MEHIIKLTPSQIHSFTKSELSAFLTKAIHVNTDQVNKIAAQSENIMKELGNISSQNVKVNETLENVTRELRDIRQDLNAVSGRVSVTENRLNEVDDMRNRMAEMEKKHKEMDEIIKDKTEELYRISCYQQRFLEEMDSYRRGNNLIFLGVPEANTTNI